jgi:hypothetical protein
VCVVASNYPDDCRAAGDGGDSPARLPSRPAAAGRQARYEARAELRDRETYYAQLRFAVHCQSRSIPVPRAPLDDAAPGTGDDLAARFGDTWT